MVTPRSDWTSLAPTPRQIPTSTRLGVRFLSSLFQVGCLVVLFCLVPLFLLSRSDVFDSLQLRGELSTASGVVTKVEDTGFGEGGGKRTRGSRREIRRVDYSFEHAGSTQSFTSYTTAEPPAVGASCEVEFVAGKPELSRIRGMRSKPFGADVLFFLFVPLIAAGMLIASQVSASRALRLLENGRPVTARLVEMNRRRGKKSRKYHRARLEFERESGETQEVTIDTKRPDVYLDERGVRVLYDPRNPGRARVFDDLPARVTLDARGRFESIAPGRLLNAVWIPGLTLGAYIAFGVWLAMS